LHRRRVKLINCVREQGPHRTCGAHQEAQPGTGGNPMAKFPFEEDSEFADLMAMNMANMMPY
jgi:hypothetical protein